MFKINRLTNKLQLVKIFLMYEMRITQKTKKSNNLESFSCSPNCWCKRK